MKRFLAVYTASSEARAQSGWDQLGDAERAKRTQEGMRSWMAWREEHADAIVDAGSPLGCTKRASRAGIADVHNNLAAWVLVEAESHEAAARLFEGHPHFTIFPGDGVEIMECLPMPGR
jgi:hypothetical protein